MILDKWIKSLGAKSYDELNTLEQQSYDELKEILDGRKITDEDVQKFFQHELEDAINKLVSLELSTREDIFLKMKVDFIQRMQSFLDRPRVEQENIKNLIETQI